MQIPVGNFGFKVAEPAQRVNAPAAAFGDAQGTADLGANLSNVADAMQAKQVKAAQEAERQMRERLQQQRRFADAGIATDQHHAARHQHRVQQVLAERLLGFDPAATQYPDSDNDGLNDIEEFKLGTDRFNADTDGDSLSDGAHAR